MIKKQNVIYASVLQQIIGKNHSQYEYNSAQHKYMVRRGYSQDISQNKKLKYVL